MPDFHTQPITPLLSGGLVVDVEDVDAHCVRARAVGARVDNPPTDQPYGRREYEARDPRESPLVVRHTHHLVRRLRVSESQVMMVLVNAAERFMNASRAHDVDGAAALLAPEVVMLNPATNDAVVGRDPVVAALRAVEAACDEFRHTHLLSEMSDDRPALFGLVFEATVGEHTLRGVDLLELDEHDRICTFTVLARPMAALMALGARMTGGARS